MKYYLIDYENVNAAGLEGIDEITADSRVVLFYTKNSSKIDLGVFNLLRTTAAELAVIEVHHGKQALDIQLGSYVGFLIGTEPADTEYYIVSKDKGYRNIQDFWSDRHIVLCTSLREDSEIVDEPKPARTGSRSSSRGGRSRTSAKAGKAEEKNVKAEETAAEAEPAEHEHHEKSGSRKGIRTKAEKNTKREKHEKVDLNEAVHPAKSQEEPAEAPKAEEAPVTAEAPEQKPVVNAFAEAAALAAAMAAARNEGSSESSAILKTAPAKAEAEDAPKGESEEAAKSASEEKPKSEKKSGRKSAAKGEKKSSAKSGKKSSAKAAKDDAPAPSLALNHAS